MEKTIFMARLRINIAQRVYQTRSHQDINGTGEDIKYNCRGYIPVIKIEKK